ncbi:hypothetical protein I5L01_15585, partial [Erythrobacter sp. YJ-T3-07]|nr:hypothetical protein [Erythrobacter sp. YJ-T3-07]
AVADKEASPATEIKKKEQREKPGYDIDNMSRVLPGQLKYISPVKGRYWPVKLDRPGPLPTGGPILVHDREPGQKKDLVEEKLKKVSTDKAPVPNAGGGGAGGRDFTRRPMASHPMPEGDLLPNQLLRQLGVDIPSSGGAAAAAGVLTAVDEDGEDDEEAEP